jgi:hypothetical protein
MSAGKQQKEWDLFICHASEDKEEIVRPLVDALVNVGYSVWYDEFELKLGDSLRRSIDKGLAQSRYGLVILSPHFFEKNWPQTELDGLAARERDGEKVILPVWHNVDEPTVREYSPTLADRVAALTSKGLDSIVKKIRNVLKPSNKAVGSVSSRLESTLNSVRTEDSETIPRIVKEGDFSDIERMFAETLEGIAFFGLPNRQAPEVDEKLFDFLELAISERNENEGKELFKILLDWYFETASPSSRIRILKVFAKLTRLKSLREIISGTKRIASFIADFGISKSFQSAGVSAEVLYNLQSLLSEKDLDTIVNYALVNPQIKDSYNATNYLEKILSSVEGRFGRTKMEELHRKLT